MPPLARFHFIDLLHISHAGQVETKKAAQQLYYWKGIDATIHDKIAGCEVSTEAIPSKPPATPLDPSASTSEPMQAVGMDLFAADSNDYWGMVDHHSGYPWVPRLTTTTSLAVTPGHQDVVRVLQPPQVHSLGRRTAVPQQGLQDILQRQRHSPRDQQPIQPRVQEKA